MLTSDEMARRSSAGSGSAAWRQVYRSSKRREALRVAQFVLLGCSGWWSSNAIWSAEQPIYIEAFATSPDSNVTTANLPIATNLAVACQLGNVGPIAYNLVWSVLLPLFLLVCGAPSTRGGAAYDAERPLLLASSAAQQPAPLQWDEAKARSERCQRRAVLPTLGACLLAAVGACLLAALMWEQTVTVNGSEVHAWLLLAELIAGLTGCMSAVTFWSFTMRFSKSSVKALSVGLSIGSLFSQGLALVQQQGRSADSTRISVRDYLLIAAAVQLLFFLNFLVLVWSSAAELRGAAAARRAAPGSDAYDYDDDAAELADAVADDGADGELSFMYRYISRESCSQFDSLPLTSLTITSLDIFFRWRERRRRRVVLGRRRARRNRGHQLLRRGEGGNENAARRARPSVCCARERRPHARRDGGRRNGGGEIYEGHDSNRRALIVRSRGGDAART